MTKQYVEKVEGVYRLAGTRVSLDSVVQAFWRGQTAESIAQSFPVLTLEEVYGALMARHSTETSNFLGYEPVGLRNGRSTREAVYAFARAPLSL